MIRNRPVAVSTTSVGQKGFRLLGGDAEGSWQSPDKGRSPAWWRRSSVQVVLVSVVCFCCPGIYNAVTSMGGGVADQSAVANSAAALYAAFVPSSLLAPSVCSALGARAALWAGTLGYIAFVAGLAAFQHLGAPAWVLVAAGVANGVSAGLLWTAQGQLVMAYPTPDSKGWFLAVFWVIFNLGAVIGGAMTAAANWGSASPTASPATYVAFLAAMCTGSGLALLLADPSAVVRPDGTAVQEGKDGHASPERDGGAWLPRCAAELRLLVSAAREPLVARLMPLALYSNWFYTYQFSCYNHALFTVRTQGVNNALYWAAQMAAASLLGRYLDGGAARLPPRGRARRSLLLTAALVLVPWAAAAALMTGAPDGGGAPPLDVAGGGRAYRTAAAIYILWGLGDSLVMVWVFWVLGQSTDSLQQLGRYAGLVKAVQALGSAISWKLNTAGVGAAPATQLWVNVALSVFGLGSAAAATAHVDGGRPDGPQEET